MYIAFKNKQYNLALPALAIKEIIQVKDIVSVPHKPNIYGVINFREQIIPISILENHIPEKGVLLIIQNKQGLGGVVS